MQNMPSVRQVADIVRLWQHPTVSTLCQDKIGIFSPSRVANCQQEPSRGGCGAKQRQVTKLFPLHCRLPRTALKLWTFYVRERLAPELARLAAGPAPEIAIPPELSHALVVRTEKLLAQGKQTDKKLIVSKNGVLPHLLVSREQMPRALRIMNALFLALEERGQSVSWSKEEEAALTLAVDGETVKFCVLEITESLRHALTPEEQKYPWMAPKWDYKLTGKLQFRVDNLPYSAGVRGTWSDVSVRPSLRSIA
jgi:hypothetical protein